MTSTQLPNNRAIGTSDQLKPANFQNADLWYADLQGANLRGADLRAAKLRGANLCGADLQGAQIDSTTQFPMPSQMWRVKINNTQIPSLLSIASITPFHISSMEIHGTQNGECISGTHQLNFTYLGLESGSETWVTRDGRELLLAQMTTDHEFHVMRMLFDQVVPEHLRLRESGLKYLKTQPLSWSARQLRMFARDIIQRDDLEPKYHADFQRMCEVLTSTSQELAISDQAAPLVITWLSQNSPGE